MKRHDATPREGRDQDPTPFAAILEELLGHEPRAHAAVLIDSEGETVDYASALATYYTKVAAAYLRIVLNDIGLAFRNLPRGDAFTQALIRARERTFYIRPLPDGYALVLILGRRVFAVSTRAVTLAAARLAEEARWTAPLEETLPWHPAEVETSRADRFRPKQMKTGDAWERVEVLGSVVERTSDPSCARERPGYAREKGYRCRLQGGAEITLVREPTGVWFVDQPSRGLSSRLGPESVPPGRPPSLPPSSSKKPPPPGGHNPAPSGSQTQRSPSERPHPGGAYESGERRAKK